MADAMRRRGQADDRPADGCELLQVGPRHAAGQHMAADAAKKCLDGAWVGAVDAVAIEDAELMRLWPAAQMPQHHLHGDQSAVMFARLPQVRQADHSMPNPRDS